MIDIAIASFLVFCGIGALIYGYRNWRITNHRDDLRWIFVGAIVILAVAFNFFTVHLLILSPQTQSIFYWIGLVCDIGVVLLALTLKIRRK